MEMMKPWKPVKGDDSPFRTIALRDCPTGFHFQNLIPDSTLTYTSELWNELITYAERFYAEYEIVGNTLVDWLNGLQLEYDRNKYRLEMALSKINLVGFDLGSTTIRTKSGTDNVVANGSDSRVNNQTDSNETDNIVLAFDSSNEEPSNKTTGNGSTAISETVTYGRGDNRTISETETTNVNRFMGEFSIDIYKKLIENYPSVLDIFVSFFKNNFSMQEGLYW